MENWERYGIVQSLSEWKMSECQARKGLGINRSEITVGTMDAST